MHGKGAHSQRDIAPRPLLCARIAAPQGRSSLCAEHSDRDQRRRCPFSKRHCAAPLLFRDQRRRCPFSKRHCAAPLLCARLATPQGSSSLSAEHSDPRSAAAVPILKETLRRAAALRQDSRPRRDRLVCVLRARYLAPWGGRTVIASRLPFCAAGQPPPLGVAPVAARCGPPRCPRFRFVSRSRSWSTRARCPH